MPDHGSSTARGRRLAAELRRLRERSGLTGDEVAQRLGWSASKVSRIERHRIGVKQADLGRLLDLYEVEEPRRGALFALARESSRRGWFEAGAGDSPAGHATYISAEAEARTVWTWEPQLVPGLLQTAEYTRAVMRGWQAMFPTPPSLLERRVRTRLVRQRRLTDDQPLEVSAVVDESVLSRKFGTGAVMAEQMDQLMRLSDLPNVDMRILPLDAEHPMCTGAFSYMQFPQVHGVALHDIVSVEHLDGAYYVEGEEGTYQYRRAFEFLLEQALDPARSRARVLETARRRWP